MNTRLIIIPDIQNYLFIFIIAPVSLKSMQAREGRLGMLLSWFLAGIEVIFFAEAYMVLCF